MRVPVGTGNNVIYTSHPPPARVVEGAMTTNDIQRYRARLQELGKKVYRSAVSAEEQARQPTGGEAAGGLSGTPVHLGDVASEAFAQELGATLLENEQYLEREVLAALDRIEKGGYGRCEHCGHQIARDRLDAVPYTRHCVMCATALRAGREVNLNEGRPASWTAGIGLRADGPPPGAPGGPEEQGPVGGDPHAAGTPGGGTAVGGLAGTNVGTGEPDDADLEGAMGNGTFDVAIETERPVEIETAGFSDHAGGAVGGTPANKRASGGKMDSEYR